MGNKLPKLVDFDAFSDFQPPRDPEADNLRFLAIAQANPDLNLSEKEIQALGSDLEAFSRSQARSEARRYQPTFLQKVYRLGKEALDGFIKSGGGSSTRAW